VRERSRQTPRRTGSRRAGTVAAATALALVAGSAVAFGVWRLTASTSSGPRQVQSVALDGSPTVNPAAPGGPSDPGSPAAAAQDVAGTAAPDAAPAASSAAPAPSAAGARAVPAAPVSGPGKAAAPSAGKAAAAGASRAARPATGTMAARTTPAPAVVKPPVTKSGAASTRPASSPAPAAAAAPVVTSGTALGTGRIQFGPTYHGDGTFYGATGAGNCMFDAGSDRMIAAMNHTDYENSQACGAFVAVTGPSGTTVTVKIVDQCPECRPGAIDLSAEAFAKLAAPSAGRIPITWRLLSPQVSGPVSYVYKSGSSQFWCAVQVRNHRNPVRTVEVKVGGSWRALPRQSFNYFLSDGGAGCGGDLRVTDIYGNQLTDSGIAVRPDAVQPGHAQFGAPR